jgi:hypothetical protein
VNAYQQSLQLDPANDRLRGFVDQLNSALPEQEPVHEEFVISQ